VNPLLSIHLAVLLFGAAGLFGRVLTLPPTLIVLGRVVFASAALGIVVALRRRHRGQLAKAHPAPGPGALQSGRGWMPMSLLGLLLAVHWVAFFQAIQVSSVAVGLLTFATFPVFAAVLEPLLPGEHFDRRTLAAAIVTLVGVGLVVPAPDLGDPIVQGALWGVFSGFTFALLSLANRTLVRRDSALTLALHQDLWATLFLLPFAFTARQLPTAEEWGLLVLLGVVFTAAAHALFIRGLRGVSAGRASVITALEPVYGVLLAWQILGERPEPRTLAGGALVLGAAVWVGRSGDGAGSPESPASRR
jgi:drug/metabolite transporter (DMT)-like permease